MAEHIIDFKLFQMIADFSANGKEFQIQTHDNVWHEVIDVELFKKPSYFVVNTNGNPTTIQVKDIKGAKLIE